MGTYPGVTFYYHRRQMRAALADLEDMSIFEEGSPDEAVRAWRFMLDGEEVVIHTYLPVSFTYDTDEWWDESDGLLDLGRHWACFDLHMPLPRGVQAPVGYSDVVVPETWFQVDVEASLRKRYGRLHLSSPSNSTTTFFLVSPAMRRLWADFGDRTGAIIIVEGDGGMEWRPFDAEAEYRFDAEAGWRKREGLEAYLVSVGVPGEG